MNLNYDRIKAKNEAGGNQWTSYSDLFMVLSVVFLLLYTVTSFRNGTLALSSRLALQEAQKEKADLRDQLATFDVLKESYLQEGASEREKKSYEKLMAKMSLLEDEAREAKQEANQKWKVAHKKETELNEYQGLIKSIVNANMIAQSKLKKRDQIIKEREENISELSAAVVKKESSIRKNNREIKKIQKELEKQIKEVKYAYRSRARAKKRLGAKISRLKAESQLKVKKLEEQNAEIEMTLGETKVQLQKKKKQLDRNRSVLAKTENEKKKLLLKLENKETSFQVAIAELQQKHQKDAKKEKKRHEQEIIKQRLSAKAKLKKEKEYRALVEQRNARYNQELSSLQGKLQNTQGEIASIETKYKKSIQNLNQKKSTLEKKLQASELREKQRKELAQRIKRNFKKAGIKAEIDGKTGDVTISFGKEYFNYGSSQVKRGMTNILKKMIPVYAKSLFHDKKVSKNIASVEIVGFASPTYRGRYVDPKGLSARDRTAVNYNMDLSYKRAKSIFEYIFDVKKMKYPYQKSLLPKVKVTGRSYLASDGLQKNSRSLSRLSDDEYCQRFDCRKSQRVVIKFNMKEQ